MLRAGWRLLEVELRKRGGPRMEGPDVEPKGAYRQKLQGQLKELEAEVERLRTKVEKAIAEARTEFSDTGGSCCTSAENRCLRYPDWLVNPACNAGIDLRPRERSVSRRAP